MRGSGVDVMGEEEDGADRGLGRRGHVDGDGGDSESKVEGSGRLLRILWKVSQFCVSRMLRMYASIPFDGLRGNVNVEA